MDTKRFFFIFIVFILLQMTGYSGPDVLVLNIDIQPETPMIYDSIDIVSSGIRGAGPVDIKNTFLQINNTFLTLDIYLQVGFLTVMTPWSHTENIGTLPAGMYDLTVTAYDDYGPPEVGVTSFEVIIPEPTSIFLLGFGGMLLWRRS